MEQVNPIDNYIKLFSNNVRALNPIEKYNRLIKSVYSQPNNSMEKREILKIISEVETRMKNIEELKRCSKEYLTSYEKSIKSAALLSSLYEKRLEENGFSPFQILSLTYNNMTSSPH